MSNSGLKQKLSKEYREEHHQKVWVVIPAAGIGKRMQSDVPKQYLKINDKTVLEHTLNCFLFHPKVLGIIVVLNTDDYYWKNIKLSPDHSKTIYTVEGGKERSDSVIQGLDYLLMVEQLAEDSWVMVHDAARPCLTENDINSLLSIRANTSVGGILASPVRDTMKRAVSNTNIISCTESREDLWHALTPQLFKIGELKDAINHCINAKNDLPQWYLLEKEKEIIGCAGLITNDFISRGDLYPWVCAVFIEEKERGNSYCSLLLNKAKSDAKKSGYNNLYLSTEHIGLYEKFGFEYIGQGYHPWEDESRIYAIELE